MTQQPDTSPGDETAEDWAARVIAQHGPPPEDVEDRIRSIVRRVNDRHT